MSPSGGHENSVLFFFLRLRRELFIDHMLASPTVNLAPAAVVLQYVERALERKVPERLMMLFSLLDSSALADLLCVMRVHACVSHIHAFVLCGLRESRAGRR